MELTKEQIEQIKQEVLDSLTLADGSTPPKNVIKEITDRTIKLYQTGELTFGGNK